MSKDDQPQPKYAFQPIHPFNMDDPKSWASTIGMMNWDNDKIVFSKRSLLEFLKSCQVTVNTNFSEIQKLPKYATFGHLSKDATDAAVRDLVDAEIADPSDSSGSSAVDAAGNPVRPSRKVRDPPGGKQSLNIVGDEYAEADALSLAPGRDGGVDVDIDRMQHLKLHVDEQVDGGAHIEDIPDKPKAGVQDAKDAKDDEQDRVVNAPEGFRPTRKVREGPGGKSQMGSVLFGGYEDETEEDRQAARAQTGGKRHSDKQASQGLW